VHRILGELPAALRSAAALRALVGFLTLFLAFRAREDGLGLSGIALLGLAAGVGSALGVFIGGRLKQVKPEVLLVVGLICATVACLAGAVFYNVVTAILAALVVTMSGSMSKLGLDAVIQRDVAEDTRNSAFARSETALQLSWVAVGRSGCCDARLVRLHPGIGVCHRRVPRGVASLRRARLYRRSARTGGRGSTQLDSMEGLSSSRRLMRRRALR